MVLEARTRIWRETHVTPIVRFRLKNVIVAQTQFSLKNRAQRSDLRGLLHLLPQSGFGIGDELLLTCAISRNQSESVTCGASNPFRWTSACPAKVLVKSCLRRYKETQDAHVHPNCRDAPHRNVLLKRPGRVNGSIHARFLGRVGGLTACTYPVQHRAL
jgi:hypothetical protein